MLSRSRKSRRGCEISPSFLSSHPRRPTDTPRQHSTSTLDQPTNQLSTHPSFPSYYYRCSSAAMPAPDATDTRSASMKMTSRQKAPRLIIKAMRLAPRTCVCVHACMHACMRACRRRHGDDDYRRGIAVQSSSS